MSIEELYELAVRRYGTRYGLDAVHTVFERMIRVKPRLKDAAHARSYIRMSVRHEAEWHREQEAMRKFVPVRLGYEFSMENPESQCIVKDALSVAIRGMATKKSAEAIRYAWPKFGFRTDIRRNSGASLSVIDKFRSHLRAALGISPPPAPRGSKQKKTRTKWTTKKVRVTEGDKNLEFPSVGDAARYMGVAESTVSVALSKGYRVRKRYHVGLV